MLVGTILQAKKKKQTKATTHLFSMRSSKGLQRMLWIATRAGFNTSLSRQTILNLACSVIHPTPDEQKQIIILWPRNKPDSSNFWFSSASSWQLKHSSLVAIASHFSQEHHSVLLILPLASRWFVSPDSLSSWSIGSWQGGYEGSNWNCWTPLITLNRTQTDAARRSKGWCYKYALLCDCEPSPYLMS